MLSYFGVQVIQLNNDIADVFADAGNFWNTADVCTCLLFIL